MWERLCTNVYSSKFNIRFNLEPIAKWFYATIVRVVTVKLLLSFIYSSHTNKHTRTHIEYIHINGMTLVKLVCPRTMTGKNPFFYHFIYTGSTRHKFYTSEHTNTHTRARIHIKFLHDTKLCTQTTSIGWHIILLFLHCHQV